MSRLAVIKGKLVLLYRPTCILSLPIHISLQKIYLPELQKFVPYICIRPCLPVDMGSVHIPGFCFATPISPTPKTLTPNFCSCTSPIYSAYLCTQARNKHIENQLFIDIKHVHQQQASINLMRPYAATESRRLGTTNSCAFPCSAFRAQTLAVIQRTVPFYQSSQTISTIDVKNVFYVFY